MSGMRAIISAGGLQAQAEVSAPVPALFRLYCCLRDY